ncbi:MAG: LPXTG cell wall anchor domain-containing protein [Oscillospiraceae bacterium]|nr:LPXTG cell wall anchor domain-containing protein [Oscillospiraceae bacterium]
MRKARRFAAIAAAAMMTAALALPMSMSSFAAGETGSITITNGTDDTTATHSFVAYQVFTGDYDAEKNTFSNIKAGDGVNVDTLLGKLQNNGTIGNYFKSITATGKTDDQIANAIVDVLNSAKTPVTEDGEGNKTGGDKIFDDNTPATRAFADCVNASLKGNGFSLTTGEKEENVAFGYYFIKDSQNPTDMGDDNTGAQTRFILQVVGDATPKTKTSAPTVEKKVVEDDKTPTAPYAQKKGYNPTTVTGLNDVADYCVGEAVSFKLIGTLPSTYGDYTTYYYEFSDILGKEFNAPTDVTVTAYAANGDTTDLTNYFVKSAATPVDKNGKSETDEGFDSEVVGAKYTFTCNDLKKINGIDEDTVIVVEYTAILNDSAVIGRPGQLNEVELVYSSNPNYKGEGDKEEEDEKGKTKKDKVIVFTYELDETKVDSLDPDRKLAGAQFKLKNAAGEFATLEMGYYGKANADSTVDTWNATTTIPDGQKAAWIVTGWDSTGTEMTSDTDGKFNIRGLDDGQYTLVETKAPEGYIKPEGTAAEFKVNLKANTKNDQSWDDFQADSALLESTEQGVQDAEGNYTGKDADGYEILNVGVAGTTNGIGTSSISNTKTSALPSTGGIGTTLFYVVGGVLVAGAGVTLITKKRIGDSEK